MYNCYLIDRNGNEQRFYPMMFKDAKEVIKLVPKVIDMLMFDSTIFERFRVAEDYTLEEQREALQSLLRYATGTSIDTFDINMAKLAFIEFCGMGRVDEKMEKIKSGTVITDRNGNEHTVFSYLVTDFEKAMELLQRIDTVNMINNVMEDDSKEALLDIVCLALDHREQPEDIIKYLDAEFAAKAIRVYFDLPMM